jgi:Ion channel
VNGSGDRFGLLFLVLVVTYLLSAFVTGSWAGAVQVMLYVAVALLALRTSRLRRRTVHQAMAAVLAGSVAALALWLIPAAGQAAGIAHSWIALILLVSVVLIVGRVLAQPEVTLQSIFGALSAYMVIGLMFAAIYAAMTKLGGGAFFANSQQGSARTFQYFSFTTLTTLGYGDFTAAAAGGRAIAVMEALLGQVFLATLVARLVAAFRAPSRRAKPVRGGPGRRPGSIKPYRYRPSRGRNGITPRSRRVRSAPRASRRHQGPPERTPQQERPGHLEEATKRVPPASRRKAQQ